MHLLIANQSFSDNTWALKCHQCTSLIGDMECLDIKTAPTECYEETSNYCIVVTQYLLNSKSYFVRCQLGYCHILIRNIYMFQMKLSMNIWMIFNQNTTSSSLSWQDHALKTTPVTSAQLVMMKKKGITY